MLVHNVFEGFAFDESLEIIDKQFDGALEGARRVVGAMRRQENVIELI